VWALRALCTTAALTLTLTDRTYAGAMAHRDGQPVPIPGYRAAILWLPSPLAGALHTALPLWEGLGMRFRLPR
jgi:hypothetical protein